LHSQNVLTSSATTLSIQANACRQASTNPIDSYTSDLLDAPLHSLHSATRIPATPSPADELPKTDKEETLAKARLVFGSRLAGPIERHDQIKKASTMIAGVLVPPKPDEPDNCCMSGCVNCVWDVFRDELEEWAAKSKEARVAMAAQAGSGSMDEDGGGSESNWGAGEEEGGDLFKGVPVGIRAFMETEKKLKLAQRAAEGRVE